MTPFDYYLLLIHLSKIPFDRKYRYAAKLLEDRQCPDNLRAFSKRIGHFVWPEKEADFILQQGISFISMIDEHYPLHLLEIYRPPLILFYEGKLSLLEKPGLAIVGSRKMTEYGKKVIDHLLLKLANRKNPPSIISGLALGVDAYAHYQALLEGLEPIAVVGTGLNQTYPKKHRSLDSLIRERGLVLSEFPPDTSPQKFHFPMRNRIIAGLCSDVVIVEAKKKSGSLITAQMALEDNRNIWAVPGSIFSENSLGCHELIREGASLLQEIQDIFAD
ncbi:DNA-protecting protein DprA [Atopobacter sp. AH10]|uniref:DNA-processing protein DprA n=1 Tax=Atopobacter sp. AH10 TaxID=2315861 RepID=UPI000EF1ADE2|nr:DNA-processing protein DprA [Atopobacter sp. AH10]RLK63392.1 DNA-protecting protein DprA [Atopobacter sp. AH10]